MAYYQLRVEKEMVLYAAEGRSTGKTVKTGTLLGLHLNGNVSIINAVPEKIYELPNLPSKVDDGWVTPFRAEKAPLPKGKVANNDA